MATHPSRYAVETHEHWRDHFEDMPFITLRPGYSFRVVPPVSGAMFRFNLRYHNLQEYFSIYYDTLEALANMNEPYYELYISTIDDVQRSTNLQNLLNIVYIHCEPEAMLAEHPELFI